MGEESGLQGVMVTVAVLGIRSGNAGLRMIQSP